MMTAILNLMMRLDQEDGCLNKNSAECYVHEILSVFYFRYFLLMAEAAI